MAVKPVTLATLGAGILVLWSGITNRSPITVIKDLFSGNALPESETGPNPITTVSYTNANSSTDSDTGDTGDTGAAGGSAAANQAIAKLMAASYGWATGQNWSDLVSLWNQESSWNNKASNPSSGAYGIPQALPYTKMPKAAWPVSAGGSSNASAQIAWGLSYIKSRYGSPVQAWAHEVANDWY